MTKKKKQAAADAARILDAHYRLGGAEHLQTEMLPAGFEWGTPNNPNYDQHSHIYPVGHSTVIEKGETWHEYKALCACYTTLSRPENIPNMGFSATLRPPTPSRPSYACGDCLATLCRRYDG